MKCLIDKGAKVSLLAEKALDDAFADWRTTIRSVEQKCITGDSLEIITCREVLFKLGASIVTPTFFVGTEMAMFPVAVLTGQNILSEEKVDLLLSRGASKWNDWHSCHGAPIRLAEESVLPPLRECVLMGEATSEVAKGQLGVVESNLLLEISVQARSRCT